MILLSNLNLDHVILYRLGQLIGLVAGHLQAYFYALKNVRWKNE